MSFDVVQLLEELGKGSNPEDIFRRIYTRFRRPVIGYFRQRGFSEEAEDLTQRTFLRVFRGISGFRGQSRFESWLYEIARNVANNWIRSQKTAKRKGEEVSLDRRSSDDPDDGREMQIEAPDSDPLESCLHIEKKRRVVAVVGKLPPRMRQCFQLYCRGFKFREIATLLGITINAVKAHIAEAKKRIREALPEYRNPDSC